jgi:hygromycin-B 4-O-kinase
MGQAFDGFFCISQRAPGEFLDSLNDDGLRRLLPALFAALDAARRVDVSDSNGFGIWEASGNAPHATWRDALLAAARDAPTDRTYGWRAALDTSPSAAAAFDEGYAAMQRLIDRCPNERHVVHSDLLNFNVLVRDDCITAVIDWGSSIYGDFVFDLAWLTFWQPWYRAWDGVDIAQAAHDHYRAIGLDMPQFAERLRCYELFIGVTGLAYQAWKRRWDEAAWTAGRVVQLSRSATGLG